MNKQVRMGESIFRNEGNCQSCHRPDQKIVGPSLQEIAQIYTQNKASIVPFLQGNQDPIVAPSEYESMKVNLELTKSMSEEQLKALEAYMLSFLPKASKNLD
jgi:cytochrome c